MYKSFNDIQAEVNKADEYDTVDLEGVYKGDGDSIKITKNILTIDGHNRTILDAQNLSQIFIVLGDSIKLKNLKLINGNAIGDDGGAIHWIGEDGSISNCTFTNNTASMGGAIYWFGNNGCVFDSIFTRNKSLEGGAIEWCGENVSINDCSFTSEQDIIGKFRNTDNAFSVEKEDDKILLDILHHLDSTHGLYCTDIKEPLEENMFQLDNQELIERLKEKIKLC